MEELKYIVFRLGEQKYGMNLKCINGIEQDYQIIPVPNAPEAVKGIINLRGNVIPVYSLKKRFGMEDDTENSEKSLLITMSSKILLAYEVDEVVTIEEMRKENINDMPLVASNDENVFLEEVLRFGDNIAITINVDNVLSETVKEMVNRMVEDNK